MQKFSYKDFTFSRYRPLAHMISNPHATHNERVELRLPKPLHPQKTMNPILNGIPWSWVSSATFNRNSLNDKWWLVEVMRRMNCTNISYSFVLNTTFFPLFLYLVFLDRLHWRVLTRITKLWFALRIFFPSIHHGYSRSKCLVTPIPSPPFSFLCHLLIVTPLNDHSMG